MRLKLPRRIPRRPDLWPRTWRRRPAATLLFVLVVAMVVVVRARTPAGSDYERCQNRTFRCVYVVDGDTIDVAAPDGNRPNTRIRLWGVDTPESAKSADGEMYFGPEASAFTKSCVENVDVRIVLDPRKSRDKYGRLLAYVYFGDPPLMLNEEIIARGYGYADTRFDHSWKQRFMDLENRARKARLGLWASIRPEQMPAWRQRYEDWKAGASQPGP